MTVAGNERAEIAAGAHALTIFRGLSNGDGRVYTATTFPKDPWAGCEHFIRMCRAVGWVTDEKDGYGVLDVLNQDGDIVQEFMIPDALAFRQIKSRLHIAVAREATVDG